VRGTGVPGAIQDRVMATPLTHIFHLYNRLGFGITYPEAKALSEKSMNEIVQALIVTSSVGTYLTEISKEEAIQISESMKDESQRQEMRKIVKQKNRSLNLAWMKKLLETKNILLEKQTLFWHNHFACRVQHPYLMQELNNIHRRFAFSNFRDLLVEVSKSPAMLLYLNNQQNRKEHANENFARELMELFTLGRGNYTEADVQEAARAFTGWAFNKETEEFEFREKTHDDGEKNIFNRKGNFGGEDVINMIMSNKQTAVFICRKMYRYYVNGNVNETHVKELADFYYQNQYNTGGLLKKIFSSSWFYSPENIGCNIKPPVEFIVGLSRQFGIKYTNDNILLKMQNALGQTLFSPPNVAGWPGGKNFIDSSTLLLRMKLPSLLLNNGNIEIEEKGDEHEKMEEENVSNNKTGTLVNWENILPLYSKIETENLFKCFLSRMPANEVMEKIKSDSNLPPKELILKIVSLPEYSLV
jgi:uncharacterized protein (DUF1800 family)